MPLKKQYSIICREINRENGEIAVYRIKEGAEEQLNQEIASLHLRAIFNPELKYYLCLKENAEAVDSLLKQRNIKGNNIGKMLDKIAVLI